MIHFADVESCYFVYVNGEQVGFDKGYRTHHPSMYEFKKLTQPLAVIVTSLEDGKFVLKNKQYFTCLSWLEGSWELKN